jgi:parallel beta-helix repeat protein
MRAWAWLLVFVLLFILPFSVEAEMLCEPPTTGDWFINETVVCLSENIVLNGSLLINASGSLILENSILQFNSSFNGQFGIENNGSLKIINSSIQNSTESNKAYFFISNAGGKIEIKDSEIRGCGFNTQTLSKQGVFIKSSDSNITNTTFISNYIGLAIYSSNNNISKNNFIYNQKIFTVMGSNNTISDNIIKNNFLGSIYVLGDNLIFERNVFENNSGSELWGIYVNNSLISNNTIVNNTANFLISGRINEVSKNLIFSNKYGLVITNGENITISNNTITDNKNHGLFLNLTKNVQIYDNLINKSEYYDIYMLSAVNTSFFNTNYTSLVKKWILDIEVVDENNEAVGDANVTIQNNLTQIVFSGLTDGDGKIPIQSLSEFEKNMSGDFSFNPHTIKIKKGGYKENITRFNLTGDTYLKILIKKEIPEDELIFNFTIISPLNETYLKYNLTNGSLLLLKVISEKNMSWCNYSFGLEPTEFYALNAINNKTFQAYINVTIMQGVFRLNFICNSSYNVTNTSSVYFTLYPTYECLTNYECASDEKCEAHKCKKLQCECGEAVNHQCVYYECCYDNNCNSTSKCNTNTHKCEPVSCACPERIINHNCDIPVGYCCNDNLCGVNQTCINHQCVNRSLSFELPERISVGENITIMVFDQNNNPVNSARIIVKYLDQVNEDNEMIIEEYYTESDGYATIPIKYSGRVEFVARKEGYYLSAKTIEVREPFNIFFALEVIVLFLACVGIVVSLLTLKRKGFRLGERGPLKLEKTVSGDLVFLRIKNKTRKRLEEIIVHDLVPKGSFIGSKIMPKIEAFDTRDDILTWELLQLLPKEEVVIEYRTRYAHKGFWVVFEGKEYRV